MKNGANKTSTLPCDMISELPGSLIETILMLLPVRDAVRTIVLSTNWRYKLTYLPKLECDGSLLFSEEPGPGQNRLSSTIKELLFTIYKILLQKVTPTLEFCLDIASLESCDGELDLLVAYLSRNNIEKLTLSFWRDEYKLSKSLFSCSRLTHLDLNGCVFEPPMTFKGFSCLTRLKFDYVSFDPKTFRRFLLSCPVLESLSLIECTSFSLEVNAPKLKYFFLEGYIDAICFENVPLLHIVCLFPESTVKILEKGRGSGLIKFFRSLPAVKNLEINYNLIMSLVAGDSIPEKLPTSLVGLRILELFQIRVGTVEEVLFILCLIRSSPNLQTRSYNSIKLECK